MIRSFIWIGREASKGKARVAWKDVCIPKKGGLGITSLRCWNKALMTYHIWNIISDRCQLWVKWIHSYRQRGRNFYEFVEAWDSTWSWKCIFGIRAEVRPFIVSKIGNVQRTNVWFDTWVLNQPLSNFCSYRDIRQMGLTKQAKVADFYMG